MCKYKAKATYKGLYAQIQMDLLKPEWSLICTSDIVNIIQSRISILFSLSNNCKLNIPQGIALLIEVRHSRVSQSSQKAKLHKMLSHFQLLTRKFLEKFFLVTQCAPFSLPAAGGLSLQPNLQNQGTCRISIFREDCWERVGDFSGEGCNFYIKNN